MAAYGLPINPGTASSNACHKSDLGKSWVVGGITYRMLKAGATIATASKKVVIHALTTGQATFSVDTTTTASSYLVAGVIPSGQVGSTGTTSLISGDYFLAIVGGINIPVVTNSATLVAGEQVGTATDAGQVDRLLTASLASLAGGSLGSATLASTAATTTVYVRITRVL